MGCADLLLVAAVSTLVAAVPCRARGVRLVEMDCRRTEGVANIGWWWRIVWVGLPEGGEGSEDSVSMPSLSSESMEEEHEEEHTH